jgi:catechol 2,3-dioxygenase-like lactoylglutathione lyase family enzyme
MERTMPDFPALGHVAVTVNDLSVSRPWYQKLFGSDPVMDEDTGTFHHVVWMLGNGTIIGINQFPKLDSSEPFNELRPGLDHISFHCASRAELEAPRRARDRPRRGGRRPVRVRPFLPGP